MTDAEGLLPPTATRHIVRHPLRGGFYGLLLGLGIALYLMLFGIIDLFEWTTPVIVVVGAIIVGVAWASVGPARRRD